MNNILRPSLVGVWAGGYAGYATSPVFDFAPALDKAFTVDGSGNVTLPTRKGPGMAFSRASGATFMDADGRVKYAPENLLNNSALFSSGGSVGSWVLSGMTANATDIINPLGGAMLSLTSAGGSTRFQQAMAVSGGQRYMMRLVVKNVNHTGTLAFYDNSSSSFGGFDLTTMSWSLPDGGQYSERFVTDLGNGFYEIGQVYTPTGTGTKALWLPFTSTAGTFLIGSFRFYRLPGSAAPPSSGSAYYGPRFEHDPVTGECLGLLIEEQRTNLALTTDILERINSRVIVARAIGKTPHAVSVTHDIEGQAYTIFPNVLTTANVPICFSVLVKNETARAISFSVFNQTGGGIWGPAFNLQTESVAPLTTHYIDASAKPIGDGWFLYSVTYNPPATEVVTVRVAYLFDNLGDVLYVDAPQFEVGDFPSSRILTFGSAATRSADLVGATVDIPAGELTVVQESRAVATTSGYLLHAGTLDSSPNLNFVRLQNGLIRMAEGSDATTVDVSINLQVVAPVDSIKFGVRIGSSGNYAIFKDGETFVNDTPSTMANSPAIASIRFDGGLNGSTNAGGGVGGNMGKQTVNRLRFYTNTLPDAELQSLTAP